MTHEPSAEARARFAQAVNAADVSAEYMAGSVGGTAALAESLRAGLKAIERLTGPVVPLELVREFIGDVSTGVLEELRGHETRLRAAEAEAGEK